MRASITRYADALKRRKEETGESGFSLIELIVVVVILGILAAIAVPVFLGLQGRAEQSAVDTAAANAASQVASNYAMERDWNADLATTTDDGTTIELQSGDSLENYCILATNGDRTSTSGPGCAAGADDDEDLT